MVARGLRLHLNGAVFGALSCVARFVTDGISTANVMADGSADKIQLVQIGREECSSARTIRQGREHLTVRRFEAVSQQSDGVQGRTVLLLESQPGFLQCLPAGIVSSVSNDQQDLVVEARVVFQMNRGGDDRVVQGGTSLHRYSLE